MKYLHLPEEEVLYQIPFAKGQQYQHAIICMEGGDCYYIATPEELAENREMVSNALSQEFDYDYEIG